MMKKITLYCLALFSLAVLNSCGSKESDAEKEQAREKWTAVEAAWNNVLKEAQKRTDLAANLVNMLNTESSMDKTKLDNLASARKKAAGLEIPFDKLSSSSVEEFRKVQREFSDALHDVMSDVRNNSSLAASASVQQLQLQEEALENTYSMARADYNNRVAAYNALFKEEKKKKDIAFKADPDAGNAPKVSF